MRCEYLAQARPRSADPQHTHSLHQQCASISKERYQRSATSDQEAREKQIPPLRGPTRHDSARRRKSGRSGPYGFAQGRRDDRGERRQEKPKNRSEDRPLHEKEKGRGMTEGRNAPASESGRNKGKRDLPSPGLRPTPFPSILNVPLP
jgi:hypothetical protein